MTAVDIAKAALMQHGFRFSHTLGQNFLLDDGWIARIAEASGVRAGDRVLEIGAGAGVLTAALCDLGADVVALEIDKALAPVQASVLAGRGARVVFEDAQKADLNAYFGGEPFYVAANIPYYLTSDLLERLTDGSLPVRAITVMVQKEACARMLAHPGEKAYGALAASVQYFGAVSQCFDVPRGAFTPPPHVDSALLHIAPYGDQNPVKPRSDRMMRRVIAACFAMRRKTLVNNLMASFAIPREAAIMVLADCELKPDVRGEALTLPQMARIADRLSAP